MGLRRFMREALRQRGIPAPTVMIRKKDRFARRVTDGLDRSDTVIDLGAHVGVVSTEFARRAGKVFAFEPNPHTFQRLRHNIRNWPNITAINAAVSDTDGTARLYFDADERDDHFTEGATLLTEKTNVADKIGTEVETVRLSRFIAELDGPVALIKMDIEGAEYQVLSDLIESDAMRKVARIYVEPHEDRILTLKPERERVEARIAELGLSDRISFDWH